MPALVLETNVKVSNPKDFVQSFSKFSANLLGKPESYISVSYKYNEFLSFHGTFDPAFLLTITSLDNITPELNEAYSKDLFAFFKEELKTPGDRGYVTFYDPGRAYLGHNGTTFAQIFGSK
ncbi:Tautomerase/MIF [Multifurca ochricompacta]|uniref:L-dopachrome isomerase n=1 Tax=Multifurca ochricompacta TaxID=376703 RepID=A0AAD4M8G7_9AGAM|nr:Tautomerase/MIF [Multifurca ochricompacta]